MSDDWFEGRYPPQRSRGDWTDVKQVCRNGHIITAYANSSAASRRKFCPKCGATTIDACPACNHPIRGHRHLEGAFTIHGDDTLDRYCENCGSAFPWQEAAIENLRDVIRESDLSEDEAREVENALPDILVDTPKTQSASLKVKRLLPKFGAAAYEVAIKVVSDVASETAKKALGLGP